VELAGRRVKKVDDRFNISRVNKKRFTTMVRVGSVFGSSGSVIPLFHKQIKFGGPLTVTHPKITRYFMTIPEAAQLVVQAVSMGQGGDVFVLDMGDLVEIIELAEKMIHLSGLSVHSDKNRPRRHRHRIHRPAPRRNCRLDLPATTLGAVI
jgi:FlaA1/EpsC-like NDP-sugar epimerase